MPSEKFNPTKPAIIPLIAASIVVIIFFGIRQPFGLFFFKQKTAYEIGVRLVGSEMCIRDRVIAGEVLKV